MGSPPGIEPAWERAKETWSRYIRLRPPQVFEDKNAVEQAGMGKDIARFGMADYDIEVNAMSIREMGLEDLVDVILAHEIGHHALAPGNLLMHARLADHVSSILGTRDKILFMVNVFTDLLVNDHLYTRKHVAIDEVYRRICLHARARGTDAQGDAFWTVYMRVYEVLWRLPDGSLGGANANAEQDRDARLSARIVRSFPKDWFNAIKNLAFIFKQYLPDNLFASMANRPLIDSITAGKDAMEKAWGFSRKSPEEGGKPGEFSYDSDLDGTTPGGNDQQQAGETVRSPEDYLNALEIIGALTDRQRGLVQYYTELSLPHLVPFPAVEARRGEPVPEGTDAWTAGEDWHDVDLVESITTSPVIVPGITTRKRVHADDAGTDVTRAPVDIDLYIDTSGSMPNPATVMSHPTLAAFIICLSALRAGASVQATSWSGPRQVMSTRGFSRNKAEILGALVHFWGDGTAFPCQVLERYEARPVDAPPVHVIVISDDDISSMIKPYDSVDASGRVTPRSGLDTLTLAMTRGRAKGSLLLNTRSVQADVLQTLEAIGFAHHPVTSWEEIVAFARSFSRKTFS